MKKSLRILTALSIAASSILFATPSHAVEAFDTENVLTSSPLSSCSSNSWWLDRNAIKVLANSNLQIEKVQVNLHKYFANQTHTIGLYEDSNGSNGNLLGTFAVTTHPALDSAGLATFVSNTPVLVNAGSYYWLELNFSGACLVDSNLSFSGTALTLNLDGARIIRRFITTIFNVNRSLHMAIFGPSSSAPGAPSSVVATATGKRSATVSFGAPASNGGSAITSYTATSTPGGITQTLTQATGGTFNFEGLQPGTAYTFAVTAINAIGTSAATTSNSVTTTPLAVASLSSISFVDDGTGTGGKIIWAGKNIDAVLFTGPASAYPGPYNYGAFTGGWNGRIRNLTPGTEYTISIYAISADGVGESKSLTFKTSATLPELAGAASSTAAQSSETKLSAMINWVNENTFNPGEAANMSNLLKKFGAIETSPYRSFVKVPTSRVSNVVAISLTPLACSIVSAKAKVNAGLVTALSGDTCTISYTVTGSSKAPVTWVRDFKFTKFAA
jgi:hypothetical protein